MVGQADSQTGSQPVEYEADRYGTIRDRAGGQCQQSPNVQPRDPTDRSPRNAGRLGLLGGDCGHLGNSVFGKRFLWRISLA